MIIRIANRFYFNYIANMDTATWILVLYFMATSGQPVAMTALPTIMRIAIERAGKHLGIVKGFENIQSEPRKGGTTAAQY